MTVKITAIMTLGALAAVAAAGCATAPRSGGEAVAGRHGDEIVVDGRLVRTGTRVVLFSDPGGFDGYSEHRFGDPSIAGPRDHPDRIRRYGTVRRGVPRDLRRAVSQIVVHYDVAGTSRRCFTILHDLRGLSCHFLLDTDGTVYQTLDVRERAWHAADANDRSVGIEIANLGAYAKPSDAGGQSLCSGKIKGQILWQRPFTDAQYEALAKLVAALAAALDVPVRAPRGADGRVLTTTLPEAERPTFAGIVGHLHVSAGKIDPGPAFAWERFLDGVSRTSPPGVSESRAVPARR